MTATMNQVLNDVQTLTPTEKGFVVQCMISSLDTKQDENSTQKWEELVKQRYNDVITKKVETVSWETIKQQVGV